MAVSEKKRLANKNNTARSTGPKSKDGKAKVALNSVKHGLRSAQVVLPGEDASAFDAMVAHWMADWQPPTDARRVLIEKAVAHAWRLRRCLKVERDHLVARGQEAVLAHRKAARERIVEPLTYLKTRPGWALARLVREREGVVWMIGAWRELAEAAAADRYCDLDAHHQRLMNLLGFDDNACAKSAGEASYASWRLVVSRDPQIDGDDDDMIETDEEDEALRATVIAFADEQIGELQSDLATRFAAEGAELGRIALGGALDDSSEGRALLRYEGQHGREFRATLNQLIKLTQTGIDLVEDDEPEAEVPAQVIAEPTVEPDPTPAPSKVTEADPAAPSKATGGSETGPEAPSAPSKATEGGPADLDRVGDALSQYLARAALSRPKR